VIDSRLEVVGVALGSATSLFQHAGQQIHVVDTKENPMIGMQSSSRLASFSLAAVLSILWCGQASAQLPDPFRNTGLEGGGWMRPFQPQTNDPTHWDVTPPPPFAIPQGTWLQYTYREPDGTPAIFIQVGPNQWVNDGNGHRFAFVEVERRPDHVTLLDRSRGLYYQILANGRGFWSLGGPWNYNASGSLQVRR
jgi:hypothetical protein